jgi:hypothetical protein
MTLTGRESRRSVVARIATPLALLVALSAFPARAEENAGWSLPVALDLKKVADGRWSEYRTDSDDGSPVVERFALVGHRAGWVAVELSLDGAALGASGAVVVRRETAGDLIDAGGAMALQVGDRPPMAIVPGHPLAPRLAFEKVPPGSFVGRETITVAAGTFHTRHHRWHLAAGAVVDAWISPDAAPLGIVRLTTTPIATTDAVTANRLELVATGRGAASGLRGEPRPFDERELFRLLGAPAEAGP